MEAIRLSWVRARHGGELKYVHQRANHGAY